VLISVCRSVLQCVAVCCSVLQCVAVCCSALQCVAVRIFDSTDVCVVSMNVHMYLRARVAVCCSVSQCVAVCCSVLLCVAVCIYARVHNQSCRCKLVNMSNLGLQRIANIYYCIFTTILFIFTTFIGRL